MKTIRLGPTSIFMLKKLGNKSSNKNNPTLSPKITGNKIPSLEIKSERGMHIVRRPITFTVIDIGSIGTIEPITLDDEQIDKLQEHLNILCNEYGIEYVDASVPDQQHPAYHK